MIKVWLTRLTGPQPVRHPVSSQGGETDRRGCRGQCPDTARIHVKRRPTTPVADPDDARDTASDTVEGSRESVRRQMSVSLRRVTAPVTPAYYLSPMLYYARRAQVSDTVGGPGQCPDTGVRRSVRRPSDRRQTGVVRRRTERAG
ncbi:hypothetical protein GCM10010207_52160 [Streptomyces atratus]|nr:hypothetical protein GCM10010207_52160 [Streptomyces atratus]